MRIDKSFAAAILPFVAAMLAAASTASADPIVVTHWGEIMDGLPWAVALDQGYLAQHGLDVQGFVGSKGGGTTIRNIVASPLPYGEVAPSAAIAAIRSGVSIKIVNNAVQTVSDFIVAVNKDSNINSLKDLVGKKWGITSPKSNTDLLSQMMLEKEGIPVDKVERPALGTIMAMIQALESNSVQAIFVLEPVWSTYKDKFKLLVHASDVLPPVLQTVGIASTDAIKEHPDTIRAIIEARRKGVDYANKHPDEAAAILVKYYEGLDPRIARDVTRELLKDHYWSEGAIDLHVLEDTVQGMKKVGILDGEVDVKSIVDSSLLPADLQTAN
jgi:NitT/TauT family transport system substrate-binding protein